MGMEALSPYVNSEDAGQKGGEMSIKQSAESKARRRVTAARRRLRKWLAKRETMCLSMALEGLGNARTTLYADSIRQANQQLETAIRRYQAIKGTRLA